MNTRLATTNIRIQQWTAVFKAKAESGLTVDEYCEQNGISRNAYYYWLRRTRNAALEHTQTTFVELNVPSDEAALQPLSMVHSFIPQLTMEKNGFVISLNSRTPKELLIMPLLGEDVLNLTFSRNEERLHHIKDFIINFFGSSDNISIYKNRLSKINTVEANLNEMYFQQLPAVFNEEEVMACSRKAEIDELQKAVCEEYSMIMLHGSLEESLLYIYEKMGVDTGFDYDKKYCSENELISHFDLEKREILMVLGDVKRMDELLLSREKKSVIVTSYKNYDFSKNCINLHKNICDEIFIYCDRTYSNTRCYLDLWKNQNVYYRYMVYNNMTVLIVKIAEKRFFFLPMTSIAAVEADADIRESRMNMQMCCEEADEGYDPYIITGEDMRDRIDTVINCLLFITEKRK